MTLPVPELPADIADAIERLALAVQRLASTPARWEENGRAVRSADLALRVAIHNRLSPDPADQLLPGARARSAQLDIPLTTFLEADRAPAPGEPWPAADVPRGPLDVALTETGAAWENPFSAEGEE